MYPICFSCQVDKMNLLFVSDSLKEKISALAAFKDYTFAASGGSVHVFKRARWQCVLPTRDANGASYSISQLLVLGEFLLAVCSDNVIRIWDHPKRQFSNEINFPENFEVSYIMHPSTYINKILVGSKQGSMQLWNIVSMKIVYTFPTQYPAPITHIAQSPVVDVVAVGLEDGSISIWDLKKDEKIVGYRQSDRVVAISFRTDEEPFMATASSNGNISIWDLQNRRLFHVIQSAHTSGALGCQYLNGQPLLLSSGHDNSIKQWLFENMNAVPRLLKSRSGHSAPPTCIRFFGSDGYNIISAAQDKSLRYSSIIRDSISTEFSQGHVEKKAKALGKAASDLKLDVILGFAENPMKAKDWDSILSFHHEMHAAKTWSVSNKKLGKHSFVSPDGSFISSTGISRCGHFGFIGTVKGSIVMHNMQSGLERRKFIGHSDRITGLVTDSVSRTLITSSMDGTLKFWSVQKGDCLHTMTFDSPITKTIAHPESGLCAVGNEDFSVSIVDIETKRVVRIFQGHTGAINDMAFSPDSRWVLSASEDGTIRTWDIPTSCCIDIFATPSIPSSISFSPTSEFVATTHKDHFGIFLWCNKSLYEDVPVKAITSRTVRMSEMPRVLMKDVEEGEDQEVAQLDANGDEVESNSEEPQEMQIIYDSVELNEQMITLSSLPKSKWLILLNMEEVRERNKPKAPPKKPEKAPFFLPTTAGPIPQFDIQKEEEDDGSHVKKNMDFSPEFVQKMTHFLAEKDDDAFFEYAKALSPATLDLNIRSLRVDDDFKELHDFLVLLEMRCDSQKDFEVVNAYLNVFLQAHADVIMAGNSMQLVEKLDSIQIKLLGNWKRLEQRMLSSKSIVNFIRKRV